MIPVQTSFPEIYYDTPEEARAARDEKADQLEAQGISSLCRATDGRRVFVISLDDSAPEPQPRPGGSPKQTPRAPKLPKRRERTDQVEYR